jgi:hypothetical protein
MNSRKPSSSRWALWVFAAALLLKSAMPFLASAAAGLQGKALVEVCSVYGVALVSPDGERSGAPMPEHAPAHGDAHCALTALAAFANAEPAPIAIVASAWHTALPPPRIAAPTAPDATAAWVALLHHGPPRPA